LDARGGSSGCGAGNGGFCQFPASDPFRSGDGPDNLRNFGPDGTRFLTFAEWIQKSKADQRHAEDEHQRAVIADERAIAADLRAERLAAKLRELGIEPE
jgi:hypothetical protein